MLQNFRVQFFGQILSPKSLKPSLDPVVSDLADKNLQKYVTLISDDLGGKVFELRVLQFLLCPTPSLFYG